MLGTRATGAGCGERERRSSLATKCGLTEHQEMQGFPSVSEQRLNEAQAVGRIGDWEFNVATQQIQWSQQAFALFGLDPANGPPAFGTFLTYFVPEDLRDCSNSFSKPLRPVKIRSRLALRNAQRQGRLPVQHRHPRTRRQRQGHEASWNRSGHHRAQAHRGSTAQKRGKVPGSLRKLP